MLRIGSGPNGRSCLEGSTLAPCQVSIILDIRMVFICILKCEQSLNNCKTTLCTELVPAQCYSADRVGFRQPRHLPTARHMTAHRAGALPTTPARLRYRHRVSLLLHVPTMQPTALPSLATRWSSPLLFIPQLLYPAHSGTPTAESTAAPLRSVTPHPKPTTALPADPSNSTTNHSYGRSPTTPLHPSCRKCLHAHYYLRSSSSPATTPCGPHQPRTAPLQPVNSHPQPAGHAVTVELACPTVDTVDSPTPVRTPPF
jgi:hypothetical protein